MLCIGKNLKQRIENLERQNAFGQHISKNPELIHQYHTMPRLQNHDSFTDTCLDMRMEHSLRAPQYMTNFIQSPAEYNQGRPSDGTDLDDQTTSKLSPEILHSAYPSTTSLSDSTKGGTSISDSPACPSLSPQSFIEHINDILTNNPSTFMRIGISQKALVIKNVICRNSRKLPMGRFTPGKANGGYQSGRFQFLPTYI